MIFMYTVVLVVLGLLKVVVVRRAAHLETKYVRAANEAAKLAHQSATKAGNSGGSRDNWPETRKVWQQTACRTSSMRTTTREDSRRRSTRA